MAEMAQVCRLLRPCQGLASSLFSPVDAGGAGWVDYANRTPGQKIFSVFLNVSITSCHQPIKKYQVGSVSDGKCSVDVSNA